MDSSVDSVNYVEFQIPKQMLFIVVILLGQSECEAMRKKMMTSVNINYV